MKHDHAGIDAWSARRYRLHLADQHDKPTRGYAWMELHALHTECHQPTSVRTSSPAAATDETPDVVECAYGPCHHPVLWSGKGRRPKYHTENCRKRAEQDRRRAERIEAERLARLQAQRDERDRQLHMAEQLVDQVEAQPEACAEAIADWMSRQSYRENEVASILRFFDTHGSQLGLLGR